MVHAFVLNNVPVRSVDTYKFLDVFIDNKLNWRNQIQALRTLCMKSLNVLRCITHRRSGGDRTSLLRLYMILVKPKFHYGCEVYSSATQAVLDKLSPVHNAAIRVATGAFRSSPIVSL